MNKQNVSHRPSGSNRNKPNDEKVDKRHSWSKFLRIPLNGTAVDPPKPVSGLRPTDPTGRKAIKPVKVGFKLSGSTLNVSMTSKTLSVPKPTPLPNSLKPRLTPLKSKGIKHQTSNVSTPDSYLDFEDSERIETRKTQTPKKPVKSTLNARKIPRKKPNAQTSSGDLLKEENNVKRVKHVRFKNTIRVRQLHCMGGGYSDMSQPLSDYVSTLRNSRSSTSIASWNPNYINGFIDIPSFVYNHLQVYQSKNEDDYETYSNSKMRYTYR